MTTSLPFAVRATVAALLAATGLAAHAGDFTLSGQLAHHNDVVRITFDVADSGNDVSLFTDSWQNGLNFDPALFVWTQIGSDWVLIDQNDDVDTPSGAQGWYDSGLTLSQPAAGRYMVTLVATFNAPNAIQLSEGFSYDGETPIALSDWTQPTADINYGDQKGGLWQLHIDGVQAVAAVPEPATWLLMALGAAALMPAARRRRSS